MIRKRSLPFRILLVVVGISLLGYLGFRLVISWRLDREVARWQAEGVPVIVADLCPVDGRSLEDDPEDGAALYREAIATMSIGDFTGSSTAFMKELLRDPVSGPANPNAIAEAGDYLRTSNAGLVFVLQAIEKPRTRFDLNWQASMVGMSDRNHLLGLMYWSRMLQARIYVALAEGRDADAVRDLEGAVWMADSLAAEPRLDAYLTRAGMLRSLAACVTRVANRATLTAATSRRLAATLSESLEKSNLTGALHGERCLGSARYLVPIGRGDAWRANPDELSQLWTLPGFGDLMDLKLLQYYDVMRDYENAARAFGSNRLPLDRVQDLGELQLPSLHLIHRERAEMVAAMELASYGMLLNARLADGQKPQSLAELLDGMDASRIDPCLDGKVGYGFLMNSKEYRIYSVGRNQIDEGGSEQYFVDGLREFRGGDIAFVRRLRPSNN
jgi:hypothetical protein